ncbi:MAG: hypothetical protein ACTHU1_12430 [Arachnia sp.]
MAEPTRIYDTVVKWWDAIQVLIVTGATTAKVAAANTGTKNIKYNDRGLRHSSNISFSTAQFRPP